jgi:Ca-activated chloride channel family protein
VLAFDLLQSDWPLKLSFPVFISNALQYLALGSDMDVRESYAPGSTPRIPRANLQQVGSPTEITLDGPLGQSVIKVPLDNSDLVLPALNKVGVYTLHPPIPQYESIAVNLLDPNESNLVPLTLTAPGNVGTVAAASAKTRVDLWWWIVACIALPLLLIEWWVYTRRVHL